MTRPPLKYEPGENPGQEALDELQGVGPGPGEEDIEQDQLGEDDAGPEELDVEDQPAEAGEQVHRRPPGQRLKELRDQAKAESERAANAERELYALRMQQEAQARQQQLQWQQQREEQNLENMPFDQQVEYRLRRAKEENDRQYQQMQFQNIVNQDKAEYMSKASSDANRRRLTDIVERTYLQSIQAGRYIPRDEIYKWARGQEVIEQETAQQGKRRTATPQAQAQRVRPPNSRGDSEVSRSRGSGRANESLTARERRLENIRF